MTEVWPYQFSATDDADLPALKDRLQEVLDRIGQLFPISTGQVSQVPQTRVHRSAAQAITTSTVTAVTFDVEDWDTANLHSTSANTSRLTANIAGLWAINGHAQWVAAAGGVARYIAIRVNGTTTIAEQVSTNSATLLMQASVGTQYRLAASDYVEFLAFQDSGGNLNVTSPAFAMHWVSP